MSRVLKDLGQEQEDATKIYYDNKLAITLLKNPIFHKGSKHIEMRYHFIIELINNGEIYLDFCKSQDKHVQTFSPRH